MSSDDRILATLAGMPGLRSMRGPRPLGWDWPLHASTHAKKRMMERGFNVLDVRMMMHRPERIFGSPGKDRWVVEADLRGRPWRVSLDPDPVRREMVVVTAFPLRRRP